MNKTVQRIVTLLLVLLLTCGIFPTVFATDAAPEDTTAESTETGESAASTETDESTEPTEPTEPVEPPVAEDILTAAPITIGSVNMQAVPMLLAADADPMLTEAAEVKGTHYQRALVWLNSDERLEFHYNGKEYRMKSLVTHGVLISGKRYLAYCIDPGVSTTESSGAYEGTETAWTDLDIDTQAAIGLAILYGAPNKLYSSDLKTQLTYEAATQIIVHEIRLGYRSTLPPYECTNAAIIDRIAHSSSAYRREIDAYVGHYTAIDGQYMNKILLREAYNTISASLASHYVLPSFASRYNAAAQTYEMTQQEDGTYAVTLTDTNGILADCTFLDGNGLTYTVNDNELTITADAPFDGIKSCSLRDGSGVSKNVPNLESETFLLWNAGDYQRFVSLQEPVNDPLPLYFNVSTAAKEGNISVMKVDTTGAALAGAEFLLEYSADNGQSWQPVFYSDHPQAGGCTSAVLTEGALTSDASGLVFFTGLQAELLYRLTETKAPDGYQLLSGPVFEGSLSADLDYELSFTVTNVPIFKLPETGSNALFLAISGMVLCCVACVGVICLLRKKEV